MHLPIGRRGAFFAIWLLMVVFLQLGPISDLDLFWQLRYGQLMLEQRGLVTMEPFSYERAGEYAPPVGWLSEVVYALLLQFGSWRALQTGHIVAFAGAFVLMGLSLHKFNPRTVSVLAAIFLGFAVSLPHSGVRSQGFAAACFAAFVWIASNRWPGWVKFLACAPLLVAWQNLHPSVQTAAVWLAPMIVVGWFRCWRSSEPAPWTFLALLGLVVGCQFATPMGWGILETQRANLAISKELGITEWLPSWEPVPGVGLFWIALGISVLLLMRLHFRIRWEDLAVFLVFTILAFTAARFALFWALALIPIWARWIDAALPPEMFQENESKQSPRWAGLCLIAAELAAVLFLLWKGPIFSDEIPREALAVLKREVPKGRIYNYREWGGPLILAGNPDWQVAIDGRLYLYDREKWNRYSREAAGEIPLGEIIAAHRPEAFFLRPDFDESLVLLLRNSPDWRPVFEDRYSVIFIRNR